MIISAIRQIFSGASGEFTSLVAQVLSVLFVIICILPLHECAHGLIAVKLGDNTPKWDKRLTLNPLASIDPMGALALLLFGFGWAKPVQVNPRNFKNPKRDMAIVALAGPLSNLLAAFVGMCILIPIFIFAPYNDFVIFIYYFLEYYVIVNIGLAVFNLLPIPPLDGSKILMAFLGDRILRYYYQYQQIITMVLFVLLFTGVLSTPLNYLENIVYNGIFDLAALPYKLFGVI